MADLKTAGISPGDIVMVHSSLSQIGNVDGGAMTVIESLLEAVTPTGTILMPCYNSAHEVQRGAEAGQIVDLRTAKSTTGILTEVFRARPDVLRSSHPFSSVCAWGASAEFVTNRHDRDPHICHHESPIGRLVELDGRIIGIGIPISVGLSVGHYLEDTWDGFPLAVYAPPFEVTYLDASGNQITRDVLRYDPECARTRIDQAANSWILHAFTTHFTKHGILQWFHVGNANAWTVNAQPLYTELKRLAEKGITMYLTKKEWQAMNSGHTDIDSW